MLIRQSEETTSLFCQMIARLSDLTQSAAPTTFHKMLRSLDERHKLLRVYTQNIDALEMKSGLTFGVPEIDPKRVKPRSHKGKVEVPPDESTVPSDEHSQSQPSPPASRLPSPPIETPRCIHYTALSRLCIVKFARIHSLCGIIWRLLPPDARHTALSAHLSKRLVSLLGSGLGQSVNSAQVLYFTTKSIRMEKRWEKL